MRFTHKDYPVYVCYIGIRCMKIIRCQFLDLRLIYNRQTHSVTNSKLLINKSFWILLCSSLFERKFESNTDHNHIGVFMLVSEFSLVLFILFLLFFFICNTINYLAQCLFSANVFRLNMKMMKYLCVVLLRFYSGYFRLDVSQRNLRRKKKESLLMTRYIRCNFSFGIFFFSVPT